MRPAGPDAPAANFMAFGERAAIAACRAKFGPGM
jgi:hypothetical protein